MASKSACQRGPEKLSRAELLETLDEEDDTAFMEGLFGADTNDDIYGEGIVCAFVGSAMTRVDRMLEMLPELGADDTVVDMGCGDGRVLIRVCQARGATCKGYDLQMQCIDAARKAAAAAGLPEERLSFEHTDLMDADYSRATYVVVYLDWECMKGLVPFEELLGGFAGLKVVTFRRPLETVTWPLLSSDKEFGVYVYEVTDRAEKDQPVAIADTPFPAAVESFVTALANASFPKACPTSREVCEGKGVSWAYGEMDVCFAAIVLRRAFQLFQDQPWQRGKCKASAGECEEAKAPGLAGTTTLGGDRVAPRGGVLRSAAVAASPSAPAAASASGSVAAAAVAPTASPAPGSAARVMTSPRSAPARVFYDVGCGRGKLVLLAAGLADSTALERAEGLDIAEPWIDQAKWLRDSWLAGAETSLLGKAVGIGPSKIDYRAEDATVLDKPTFEDGDVVLCNNLVFDDELNARLARKAELMRPGAVFLSPVVLPSDEFLTYECSKAYFGVDDITDLCENDVWVQVRRGFRQTTYFEAAQIDSQTGRQTD